MRRLIFAAVLLGALLLVAAGGAYWQFTQWSNSALMVADTDRLPAAIQLEPGESLSVLARRLERDGLIDHGRWLVWLARLRGLDTRLQAGEYAVYAHSTPLSLLTRMVTGDVIMHQFRIAEGHTVAQVLRSMQGDAVLIHELNTSDPTELATQLSVPAGHMEGMLFPDTYQFARGMTDRELLMLAHDAMQAALAAAWADRDADLALRSPHDLLVLASIIEKESGVADDRAQISQVFHRRLALNMRLQTDPTVIYGLGDAFDGNLTRAHLRTDTPYNTYTRHGLPPTPIAIPSAAALNAAAHPAQGDFLYFVARGDGSSQFSRTLDEHNRAVRKFQLGLN